MMLARRAAPATGVRRRGGIRISERKLLLASGDAVLVAGSLIAAFNLRSAAIQHRAFSIPWTATTIATCSWLALALMVDAYDLRAAVSVRSIFRVVATMVALVMVTLLVVFFFVPYEVTRPTLLLWVPIASLTVLGWRLFYRRVFAHAIFAGRILLLVGAGVREETWPEIDSAVEGLYLVVGTLDPGDPDVDRRLSESIRRGQIDQIVVDANDGMRPSLFESLVDCFDNGITVRSLADVYEELTGRLLIERLGQTWILTMQKPNETSRLYAFFKRVIDMVAGLVGVALMALIVPLVWFATRLDDRGPVFHRQVRIGLYGKPFRILKLRTMRDEDGDDLRWTEADDARVTRVGRVLRRLHLDELPQAWNILRGEMSVVGPRPEQPQYVESLRQTIRYYNTRLSVRPGLTGWAQVNYGYGSGEEGARVKLSYDLYYIKRQSIALDLLIVARTVFAVAALRGR